MSNYYKLKQSAPDQSLYMKSGDSMIFIHPADIKVYNDMLTLLDIKDVEIAQLNKKIETMDKAFRVIETALKSRGIL